MSAAQSALLVVDDNEDNRYTLTRRLAREGYENLTVAGDGRQALELLATRNFDLVLLDVMMPGLNGYQVLERMRADDRLRHIPVIMISAMDEIESVIRCVELGAEDYLPKPFNPTLLRARVGASLEKKRLRDEVRASLQRLEQELQAAHKLQLGMLPGEFPAWSAQQPVQIYALMDPANEVGGDLYDFFDAGDGVFCFLVGDVSGKGASAAMFMARAQSLVRMAVQVWRRTGGEDASPARIAEAVSRELYQNNRDRMFVTMFLGFLDTKTGVLAYVNAGHLRPHILHGSTEIRQIAGKPEAPLAVRRHSQYQNRTETLRPGDALFICTDGIIEAVSAGEEFYGNERLEADLRAACKSTPEELVRIVKEHVNAFTGKAPKADDLTMLALRWVPARGLAPSATNMPQGNEEGSGMPARLPHTTDLVIANDLAQLAIVTGAIERIGVEHGAPAKSLMQLQVALDEMVSNVIKYAWPDRNAHEIRIRITVLADQVTVEITDDGRPFNPLLARPPEPLPSGPRPPGGLGIHMVRQLVDGFDYARIDGRNQVTLIKRCVMGAPGP